MHIQLISNSIFLPIQTHSYIIMFIFPCISGWSDACIISQAWNELQVWEAMYSHEAVWHSSGAVGFMLCNSRSTWSTHQLLTEYYLPGSFSFSLAHWTQLNPSHKNSKGSKMGVTFTNYAFKSHNYCIIQVSKQGLQKSYFYIQNGFKQVKWLFLKCYYLN